MCSKGTMRLVLIAGLLICSGLCQNAEPGRHYQDSEKQHDDFWDVPPEGPKTMRLDVEERAAPLVKEATSALPRATGNENATLLPGNHGESFDLQLSTNASMKSRESRADRRRKRFERRKQYRRERRRRMRKEQKERGEHNRRSRNRNREMNVRRWNRDHRQNRLENRRKDPKWRDNLMTRLVKMLNKQTSSKVDPLIENSLNLSMTNFGEDAETSKVFEAANATSSLDYPIQLTTEPRIPEPPEPTSRYHVVPGDTEREFSRQMEREFSRTQLAEKTAIRQDEENEDEEEREEDEEEEEEKTNEVDENFPRFDERYPQAIKQSKPIVRASYDPERMLGYSRTDEDLPILALEKEVLQRTLKDYDAYMSSSIARAAKSDKTNEDSNIFNQGRKSKEWWMSSSTEAVVSLTDDDDPRGDLSCINGTFVPAPHIHHAVIKYVKSSRPGHEYLEADYECEEDFAMPNNASGARLLCSKRRWIGRPPMCRFSGNDETTCARLGCEHLCRIVEGKATCQCREGFRIEGRRCIDIDECRTNEGRGPCQDTCRNYPGGFMCSCETRLGAVLAPDNRTCQESERSIAGPCSYENAGCSHTCLASMGRVFCLCPDGFMLEDDWKTCQDVDECAVPDLQTEVCNFGCVNTPGSYWCEPPPRSVDLLEGVLRRSEECLIGYEVTATKNCVDINECSTNNGGCSEICENTEGSFFCACEGDERILASDKTTCIVAEKQFESLDREATLSMRFHEVGDVSCSPLNPAGRGYLICSDSEITSTAATDSSTRYKTEMSEEVERQPIRPRTKCYLKCPHGYELHGEYELTCRVDGTWDGPKHGECLRYSKPRLDCPKDIAAELPPGRDEAFVTYDQPSTDLDWFRYVHSKPSWGTRLEANLKKGVHEITFYARHPVSKKQTSCTLKITVEDGQAPKVSGCPSDIEITGRNGSAITWIEPTFTDNIKITRITNNESSGRNFSLGGHKVEYEASDEAGWTTKCIFTVVLRPVTE